MTTSNGMLAAYLTGPSRLELRRIPAPRPPVGGVLVRVRSVGLCGSDGRVFLQGSPRVTYPAVVGHEIAGEVAAVGAGVSGWRVGDRVAVGTVVSCGKCRSCKEGVENLCEEAVMIGYQRPGGLAEFLPLGRDVLARGQIAKIPAGLNFDVAALAEPLAAVVNGIERAGQIKGKSFLVLGSGGAACLAALAARAGRAGKIVLCGHNAPSVRKVLPKTIDVVPARGFEETRRALQKLAGAGGFERIFVASDSAEMQTLAVSILAKRGTAVLFGVVPRGEMTRINANDIHYNESAIVGSFGATRLQFRAALGVLGTLKNDFRNLITHRFRLQDIHTAYGAMADRRRIKIVVNP